MNRQIENKNFRESIYNINASVRPFSYKPMDSTET